MVPTTRVRLGVDDGDGVAAAVHGVDLVAAWVGGQSGGLSSNLQRALLAQIDEVQHRDRAAGAVGDIGELAVVGRVAREAVAPAAAEEKRRDQESEAERPQPRPSSDRAPCNGFVQAKGEQRRQAHLSKCMGESCQAAMRKDSAAEAATPQGQACLSERHGGFTRLSGQA